MKFAQVKKTNGNRMKSEEKFGAHHLLMSEAKEDYRRPPSFTFSDLRAVTE